MKTVRITVQAQIPDGMDLGAAAEGFNTILDKGLACLDNVYESGDYGEFEMIASCLEFPMSLTEVVPV